MEECFSTGTRVTLKDIAEKTGVSINTVSRALKNKEDISVSTRNRIQKTAEKMGYISNSIAGSLRSGYSKTIAVLVGDISNPHFSILVKEIESSMRKHDYTTLILNTDEDNEKERKSLLSALSKKVDGIILCPSQENEDNILFLKNTGVPFVLIGRWFEELDTDYVICDDVKGGYLATKHLIECGHRKILFLNSMHHISSAKERLQGYKQALKEYDIPFSDSLVRETGAKTGICREIMSSVLEEKLSFSAIFAFNDMMAWECMSVLHMHGLRVPQDIGIVGFDNIQSRMLFPCPLTTISTFKSKLSHKAVDILLERMNQLNGSRNYNEVIDTQLIVRGSTSM
jgi:LacI family transcriptional regulator